MPVNPWQGCRGVQPEGGKATEAWWRLVQKIKEPGIWTWELSQQTWCPFPLNHVPSGRPKSTAAQKEAWPVLTSHR